MGECRLQRHALGCALAAISNGPLLLFCALLALRHLGQGLMSMAGGTTVVRYLDLQFGVKVPESTFSLARLERAR